MPSRRAVLALALALATAAVGCRADDGEPYYGTLTRPSEKDLHTLYVNNGTEPEYLDPGKATDTSSGTLLASLFEGLLQYAPDATPVPAVAERWDISEDNRLYRFHLRRDAKWSDGRPVTAHDFAYAWRRVLLPKTASRGASGLYVLVNGELLNLGRLKVTTRDVDVLSEARDGSQVVRRLPKGTALRILGEPKPKDAFAQVAEHTDLPTFRPAPADATAPTADAKPVDPPSIGFVPTAALESDASLVGVRATDDHTLEVQLQNPTPYFLDLCCHSSLMPVRRDVVEPFEERGEADLWFRAEHLVNNGPYVLDEWKFRYEITMRRNPHHHLHNSLKIHRIVWLMVEEYTSTLQLYRTAELDWMGQNSTLPQEYIPMLSAKKDFETVEYLGTYWYELNVEKPPMNDVRVRKALNLAMDKQQIVEKVTLAGQKPATHFVPDITGLGYADAAKADRKRGVDPFAGPDADFNPERARALLGEAGFAVERSGDGWRCNGIPPIEILYNTSEGHRKIAVAIQDMWRRHLGISATLRNEEWKVMLKNLRDGNFQIARMGWIADYNHPQTFLDNFLSFSPNNRTRYVDKELDEVLRRAAATRDATASMALYRQAERRAVDGMSRIPIYFYTKNTMVKPWVKGFHFNARNQMQPRWMWMDLDWRSGSAAPRRQPAVPVPVAQPPGRY